VTGRREIISTEGAFHGRTYGSLSATGIDQYREYLNTPVPCHKVLAAESVVDSVSEETAGVIMEPIQSMGGVIEIDAGLLQQIERACRSKGALLIFDEVQTGVGRTGSFLYSRQVDVLPDITTLAKGVGSGYSTGAVLTSEAVARKVSHGDLGSTFGGSPLSCAAIQATLDVIESENLVEKAASVGDYLKEKLLRFERVEEVRGKGLLLGLKFRSEPAKEVQQALLDRRVLTGGSSDPQVLRLMPALILGRNEADLFLETLEAIWE
jgi:acetylornithine aminotransferase/acetylornithine/N-succinyldiaminopimelate aminotransferase